MREVRGRTRPCKPIPPTYPNIVSLEKWDTKYTEYVMTQEQLQEVIAKYGPPSAPLSSRKLVISAQRPGKKVKHAGI
jgi:hypothetical protein